MKIIQIQRIFKAFLTLMFVSGGFNLTASQFPRVDPASVWQGVIELQDDTLLKYVLNDLPGAVCVLTPTQNGKFKANILGDKVLKPKTELPKLNAIPTPLISTAVSGNVAAGISYLSFISASFGKTNDVRFSAVESANSVALDSQIDWAAFSNRVASIRRRYTNLPPHTVFGVVRVASVLTITYQAFRSVNSSGKISGWGFSGDAKYLSQSSDISTAYKVGVNLTYSDDFMREIYPQWNMVQNTTKPAGMGKGIMGIMGATDLTDGLVKEKLESGFSIALARQVDGPAISGGEELLE